jgi:hypothetical protein
MMTRAASAIPAIRRGGLFSRIAGTIRAAQAEPTVGSLRPQLPLPIGRPVALSNDGGPSRDDAEAETQSVEPRSTAAVRTAPFLIEAPQPGPTPIPVGPPPTRDPFGLRREAPFLIEAPQPGPTPIRAEPLPARDPFGLRRDASVDPPQAAPQLALPPGRPNPCAAPEAVASLAATFRPTSEAPVALLPPVRRLDGDRGDVRAPLVSAATRPRPAAECATPGRPPIPPHATPASGLVARQARQAPPHMPPERSELPNIEIHIGRIELRSARAPAVEPLAAAAPRPVPSLTAYLARRSRGGAS